MPVNSTHRDYEAALHRWRRVRDCLEGSDSVKERGDAYLPKLTGMSDDEYVAYKSRALFFDATERTHSGLIGALFRQDPVVEVDTRAEALLDDIDLDGANLTTFAKRVSGEVLALGRYGILVDFSDAQGRPYLSGYMAENIINWRHRHIGGDRVLDQVVVREWIEEPSLDGFGSSVLEQFRVLTLDEDGLYIQQVYRRPAENADPVLIETLMPNIRKKRFDYIPFFFVSPYDLTADVHKPPLLGMADLNLAHYRNSADLEHGRHFTGLPTPYVTGVDDDEGNTTWDIGGSTVWMLPQGSTVGMLEFTGTGLSALQEGLKEKEQQMAKIGLSLFMDEKAGVESAASRMVRSSSEKSVLAATSETVGDALRMALSVLSQWADGSEEVEFSLNKEFYDFVLEPTMVAELRNAYNDGVLLIEDVVWNLIRAGMVRPDVTVEEVVGILETRQMERMQQAQEALGEDPVEESPPGAKLKVVS